MDQIFLDWLKKELAEINKQLKSMQLHNPLREKWMPRKEVMEFLGYGATQMAQLEKKLITTKIGKRKFYLRNSLEHLLDQGKG
jgi:hypothetical protein